MKWRNISPKAAVNVVVVLFGLNKKNYFALLKKKPLINMYSRIAKLHFDRAIKQWIIKHNLWKYFDKYISNHWELKWHTKWTLKTKSLRTYSFIAVVHQYYQSEVNNEYVIRGNAAILKCSIPSFVAEFVQVVGWQDDQGNSFDPDQGNGTNLNS